MSAQSRRLAVIDLGTHTMLLLIVDVQGVSYRIVRSEQRIVGLGRGIEKTGLIRGDAQSETLSALEEYKAILKEFRVEAVRMTATAVLRDARNAGEVKEALERAAGFAITVLPGEEEARLIYKAGVHAFPDLTKATVIDIGGGSVEFVQGVKGEVARLKSLPLGVVKLTERFIRHFPVPPEDLRALNDFLSQVYPRELSGYEKGDGTLVGVAGTFTTASAMTQGLAVYDPARITGSVIRRRDAGVWLQRLSAMTLEEQKKIPGLHPKRAGIIVAGFALIHSFFKLFGAEQIIVSDEGLRFGVLQDWLEKI